MTTQFEIDCALMAGASYISTRSDINKFPVPQGWAEQVTLRVKNDSSGFEATTFRNYYNPNEIVISFAGTDDKDFTGDWLADSGLITGIGSVQLLQAAEYYLQVKAAYPGDDTVITFTGHSLGGGLAALLGVFFGVQAVTFDQAPFANSAEAAYDPSTLALNDPAAILLSLLQQGGRYSEADLSGLANFLQLREVLGGIPNSQFVSNIRVDGEWLSTIPVSALADTICLPAAITELSHGATDLSGFELHSMALLTAFLQSDQNGVDGPTLRAVTYRLPSLLEMLFDKSLYAYDTDISNILHVNLLEDLIRHQVGVIDPVTGSTTIAADGMLDRFTADLWDVAQDGGLTMANNDLTKALTAFAMQAYYENRLAPNETLFDTDTFAVTGGIRFDRGDVAEDLFNDAPGFYLYFRNYLLTKSVSERAAIYEQLPELRDWFIQAGSQAMIATAGTERAFMLGGSGNDILTGGIQADVLVGNGGNDTLDGGQGEDWMIGGDGMDTYIIQGNDHIRDTDLNLIYHQNQLLAGTFLRQGATNTFQFLGDNAITLTFHSPGHLVLNGIDSITFDLQTSAADFSDGAFGLTLCEQVVADIVLTASSDDRNEMGIVKVGSDPTNWRLTYTAFPQGTTSNTPFFGQWLTVVAPQLTITGGASGDFLFGFNRRDHISGGAGDDIVMGNMTLWGGQPTYSDLPDGDLLEGDAGDDWIVGSGGDDQIVSGSGHDIADGLDGRDYLIGEEGNDVLAGGSHDDVLLGGDGDDVLFGDGYFSLSSSLSLDTRSQFTVEFGYAGAFGEGYPIDVTTNGFEILSAPEVGNDILTGGAGRDVLSGGGGNDILLGEAGNDSLQGDGGDDLLDGGAGNDLMIGGAGNDSYVLSPGAGQDIITETGGTDAIRINGALPGDLKVSRGQHDLTLAIAGTMDSLTVVGWFDVSASTYRGIERFEFDNGMVWDALAVESKITVAAGTGGNDVIYASSGGDTLDGGAGNDDYYGGVGNDVYILKPDYGDDVIQFDPGGYDTVMMAMGYDRSSLIMFQSGTNMVVKLGSSSQLTLTDWFTAGGNQIEHFAFDDGTDFTNVSIGTAANNTLYGTAGNDGIDGGAGNDYIYGYAGNDYLYGNVGYDSLYGDDGDDHLYGGSGYGDTLYGGGGTDHLDGGGGGDYLFGGAGSDTYFFGRGYYHSNVDDLINADGWMYTLGDEGDVDTILLGAGISPKDISLTWDGDTWSGTWFNLQIGSNFDDYLSLSTHPDVDPMPGGIERLQFANGQEVMITELLDRLMTGTAGNDALYGSEATSTHVLSGLEGNDRLYGCSADEILLGGEGDDFLSGNGNDWQDGSGGIDQLYGEAGNDSLSGQGYLDGGDGNDSLRGLFGSQMATTFIGGTGNDGLLGGNGDDWLEGGIGDDIIDGSQGADTYFYSIGDGSDTILNYDWYSCRMEEDTISFRSGITLTDLELFKSYDNLIMKIGTNGDQLTFTGWYQGYDWLEPGIIISPNQIGQFVFADGTVMSSKELLSQEIIHLTPIMGGDGNDYLYGSAGEDLIYGEIGNDIITGWTGADTLVGGDGDDTYLFNLGDGVDQIVDSGGTDTALFGAGITPDSLTLGLGSLLVRVGGQGDAIHIENFNPDDPYNSAVIEKFQFADGTVLDIADLLAHGFDIRGSNGDDLLTGTAINDRITGGEGSDTLVGGRGDDTLAGGGGNDIYVFNLGDGVDTIEDVSSAAEGSLITFGAGIASSDLAFWMDASDLLISVGLQGDALRFKNFERFGNNGSLIADTLQFADGSQVSMFQYTNNAPIVAVTPPNQAAMEDLAYSFTIPAETFADVDSGDSLTCSALCDNGNALPDWLTFDPTTNTFSGTPANGDIGFLNLTVSATDTAGTSAAVTFAMDIVNVNDAPTIGVHLPVQLATEDLPFSFTIPEDAFVDIDAGDSLTYSVGMADGVTLPSWLSFDVTTRTFSGTPTSTSAGLWDVRVTATDKDGAGVSEGLVFDIANHIVGAANGNALNGSDRRDMIEGLGGNDTINGSNGNDVIVGGAGSDKLKGGGGDDLFLVEGTDKGFDTFTGGDGFDSIVGGIGDDTIRLHHFSGVNTVEAIDGGAGHNIIAGTKKGNLIDLGATTLVNIDRIESGLGNDTVIGSIGNDVIIGGAGSDNLQGGGGDDLFLVEGTDKGFDTFNGGDGYDTIIGGPGDDTIRLHNFSGVNTVEVIDGGAGHNIIAGSSKGNLIDLSCTNLVNIAMIDAGFGDDTVIGSSGDDIIIGGAGRDTLKGGSGGDTYLFILGDGSDIINNFDATGFDRVSFGVGIGQASVVLFRNGNNLEIGYSNIDKVSVRNFFSDANSMVDEVCLADGSFLSGADIHQVINDMAAYAENEVMPLNSINDVWANDQLMNLVIGTWHW